MKLIRHVLGHSVMALAVLFGASTLTILVAIYSLAIWLLPNDEGEIAREAFRED